MKAEDILNSLSNEDFNAAQHGELPYSPLDDEVEQMDDVFDSDVKAALARAKELNLNPKSYQYTDEFGNDVTDKFEDLKSSRAKQILDMFEKKCKKSTKADKENEDPDVEGEEA